MISLRDARRYIDDTGAGYGQDVVLPDDIDTSECQEFFGTRCSYNIHVKDSRIAHVDRVDPRKNPIGHLKKDVGIPYVVMTTLVGTAIGAAVKKSKKGALEGGIAGLVLGAIADYDYKNNSNGGSA